MSLPLKFLGAFLATFLLSRLTLAGAGGTARGWPRIVVAHLVSLGVLMVFVGLLKAYWTVFAWDAGLVYVLPQALWLTYDLLRAERRR